MKSHYWVLGIIAIAVLFSAVQCSRCSGQDEAQGVVDVPGKVLKDARIREGADKLEWEQVQLSSSTDVFKTAIASVLQQEQALIDELIECGPLQGTWAISPVKKQMEEHLSNGKLTFCHLSSHNLKTSSRVSSVRGEFLNDSLVQLQFKFRKENHDALAAELTSRFGNGDPRKLKEASLNQQQVQPFLLWKVNGTTWGLKKGNKDITLYVQDVDRLSELPIAPDKTDTAPPKKTDLSDIGIKGSPYDVNLDELDELDDIDVPVDTVKTPDTATSPI